MERTCGCDPSPRASPVRTLLHGERGWWTDSERDRETDTHTHSLSHRERERERQREKEGREPERLPAKAEERAMAPQDPEKKAGAHSAEHSKENMTSDARIGGGIGAEPKAWLVIMCALCHPLCRSFEELASLAAA